MNTLIFVAGSGSRQSSAYCWLWYSRGTAGHGRVQDDLRHPADGGRCGICLSWRSLLNISNGWVNYFLSVVGIPQPNWLGDPHTAMLSIILVYAWGGVPIIAIIVLAGLLLLPEDPFNAARIDGASEFAIFWLLRRLNPIGPCLCHDVPDY